MECPEPRVALGLTLRGLASSAIDLSDGLLGDLGHVLRRSGVGARVELAALPRSAVLAAQAPAMQNECLLRGGDDYELLFTAAPTAKAQVLQAAAQSGVAVSAIGHITAQPGLLLVGDDGREQSVSALGFDHFG
jgi:thiamine-monophosphate kinase